MPLSFLFFKEQEARWQDDDFQAQEYTDVEYESWTCLKGPQFPLYSCRTSEVCDSGWSLMVSTLKSHPFHRKDRGWQLLAKPNVQALV